MLVDPGGNYSKGRHSGLIYYATVTVPLHLLCASLLYNIGVSEAINVGAILGF